MYEAVFRKLYHELSSSKQERVGFILEDQKLVEVPNISANPEEAFAISVEDLIKYTNQAVATWHTHPNADSMLSQDDYVGFLNWDHLKHLIIGNDGLRVYSVTEDGLVVETKKVDFAREA